MQEVYFKNVPPRKTPSGHASKAVGKTPVASVASVAVDKSIANLKLSQAVGQRIIYAYDGWTPPRLLREMIGRGEVGGIIIFKRNVKSDSHLAATLKQLQAIPRPAGLKAPLLIMVDQEGGRVKRLAGPPDQSLG